MKTLKESILGDIEDQVKEISDVASIWHWLETYTELKNRRNPENLYKVNKDGSVDILTDLVILNKDITNIPFPINEVHGKFEIHRCDNMIDYSNIPNKCKTMEIMFTSKAVLENKTIELCGSNWTEICIIFGSTPKKIKNVTLKYTGEMAEPTIQFVTFSENMIKGVSFEGFKKIELRTDWSKLSADKVNKYLDHFGDVYCIEPLFLKNGSIRLRRNQYIEHPTDSFYEEHYRSDLRTWIKVEN